MAKKVSKRATKVVKKKWYSIVTPKFLGGNSIGESYLVTPESAFNRKIRLNLMQVSGDVRDQSSAVKFIVTGFKDNHLQTRLVGYNHIPSAIKRMVRRRMSRVDDSFNAETKDNAVVRIKPMVLTRGKVSKAVKYNLRKSIKNELIERIKKLTYEELFVQVLKNNLQNDLKKKFTKIYPLRTVLIRAVVEVKPGAKKIKEVKKEEVKVEEKPKKEVKEEKKEEKPKKTEKKPAKKKAEPKKEKKAERKPAKKSAKKAVKKPAAKKKPAKKKK